MHLSTIDLIAVATYAMFIFVQAQIVLREKASHEKNSQDYFLASRSLRST